MAFSKPRGRAAPTFARPDPADGAVGQSPRRLRVWPGVARLLWPRCDNPRRGLGRWSASAFARRIAHRHDAGFAHDALWWRGPLLALQLAGEHYSLSLVAEWQATDFSHFQALEVWLLGLLVLRFLAAAAPAGDEAAAAAYSRPSCLAARTQQRSAGDAGSDRSCEPLQTALREPVARKIGASRSRLCSPGSRSWPRQPPGWRCTAWRPVTGGWRRRPRCRSARRGRRRPGV